jgi:hypothetical protein
LILPASSRIGAAAESDLLPATAAEVSRLGLRPRELALNGGFFPSGVAEHLAATTRSRPLASRRTNRRVARYRVGCEGGISHLKRSYGLRRYAYAVNTGRPHLSGLDDAGLQPGNPRIRGA